MHRFPRIQWRRAGWHHALGLSLLALLSACGGGGGGGGGNTGSGVDTVTLTADVYPLATGDRRTWRNAVAGGALRSERVGAATAVPAGSALAVLSEGGDVEYLQKTTGALLSVPGPGSDALTTAVGPIELLRFGLAAGQTVVTYDRTVSVDLDADGRADSLALRIESSFVGYEAVDTAAGRFTGAARVRTTLRTVVRLAGSTASVTLNVSSDDWYAPGIGPVRSSTTTSGDGTPTETTTEEVIAYGVGSLRSETVAPTLLSSSPVADGLSSPNGLLTLNFSEALDPLTLDGSTGVTLVNAAGVAVNATRSLNQGGQQIVFVPQAPLPDGHYELRTGSAVTDLANNPLPPVVRAFTVDTTGPKLVSSTPANGAEDVAPTGTVTLRFSEPVFVIGSGAPQLQLTGDSSQPAIMLPAVIQGSEIVATLPAALDRNRDYVLSTRTSLADATGNPAANVSISFRSDPGPLSRPAALMADAAVSSVTLGDVNNDGRADLVFVAQQTGSTTMFIGARLRQADGSYGAPARLRTVASNGICASMSLLMADFNGDGRADIATSCSGVTVLVQQTDGSFVAETAARDIGNLHIAAVDRLGDGHAELVISSFTQFSFLRRDASGVWTAVMTVDAGSPFLSKWQLADLNGDGRADLVWVRSTADQTGFELAWAHREGAGFGAVRSTALGPAASMAGPGMSVGDINGDGRPDVVLLSGIDSVRQLVALRQNATGGFDAATTLSSYSTAATTTVGDVNGDGRLDVVVSHSVVRSVGVYLQAADGSLQAERLFESGYGYFEYSDAVVLADLNGDGRTDIVVTDSVLSGRATTGAWPLQSWVGTAAAAAAPAAQAAQAAQALAAPTTAAASAVRSTSWRARLRLPCSCQARAE